MLRFKKASQNDLPAVMKLFRRVRASLEIEGLKFYSGPYPSEEDFQSDIDAGLLYIGKHNGMLAAIASVSFSLVDEFFGVSHDERKVLDLLNMTNAKDGEDCLIIHRLMVDPLFRRIGLGKEMLYYLMGLYPHRLTLLVTHDENLPAKSFYLHNGFKYAGMLTPEHGQNPPVSYPLFYKR